MMVNQTIKHIRAFDNFSTDKRVVLNYTSSAKEIDGITRSAVNSFFVSCKQESCFISMNDFQLRNVDGDTINRFDGTYSKIEYTGNTGQREILFQTKFPNESVKILFLNRNKSVRVIENTFDKTQIKGSLFKRTVTELPNLEYVERI
jgi:hypothetical protein